jgi:hypothetical protein
MKHAVIDLNAQRAKNACTGNFYNILRRQPNGPFEPLAEAVYGSYTNMFAYLYHCRGLGQMWVGHYKEHSEIYDESKHGLKPFGLCSVGDRRLGFTPYSGHEELLDESYRARIPTKEVNCPRTSHNYTQDIKS